jgi:hypothetical protein
MIGRLLEEDADLIGHLDQPLNVHAATVLPSR